MWFFDFLCAIHGGYLVQLSQLGIQASAMPIIILSLRKPSHNVGVLQGLLGLLSCVPPCKTPAYVVWKLREATMTGKSDTLASPHTI